MWPGSVGPAAHAIIGITDVIDSDVCLLPMVTEVSKTFMRLHGHYKNHFLPLPGGLLDQPAAFPSAMALIDSEFAKLREQAMDKARRRV